MQEGQRESNRQLGAQERGNGGQEGDEDQTGEDEYRRHPEELPPDVLRAVARIGGASPLGQEKARQ